MQKEIIEAVLDESDLIGSIKMPPRNISERILIWLRIKKPEMRNLYIKGATAHTMFQISKLLLSLQRSSNEQLDEFKIYDLMQSNVSKIVMFIAISVHNSKGNPPDWLIDGLETQFEVEDLKAMVSVAYRRLGIEPFFGIMALLGRPELNLIGTQETEVPGQPSEE